MDNKDWEEIYKKFPKAKKIAVENFTMSYDKYDSEVENNLNYDSKVYKWNKDTVAAINYIFRNYKK